MFARSLEVLGLTRGKDKEVGSHRTNTLNKNIRTVNCKNLVSITTTKAQAEYDRHKDFTLALGNVQSIKNKDDIIAKILT